jgi:hypothetical protein
MVVQMSTSPLRFKLEFFSVIECMTKDGRDVQEKERKHTTDREIADTKKGLLERELLRRGWTVTSGDRYQYSDMQKWFIIQKRIFEIEGK